MAPVTTTPNLRYDRKEHTDMVATTINRIFQNMAHLTTNAESILTESNTGNTTQFPAELNSLQSNITHWKTGTEYSTSQWSNVTTYFMRHYNRTNINGNAKYNTTHYTLVPLNTSSDILEEPIRTTSSSLFSFLPNVTASGPIHEVAAMLKDGRVPDGSANWDNGTDTVSTGNWTDLDMHDITTPSPWNWKDNYLWLPYVLLAFSLVTFLFGSFLRFHCVNKERYELRRIRRQAHFEEMEKQAKERAEKELASGSQLSSRKSPLSQRLAYYRRRFSRSRSRRGKYPRGRPIGTLQHMAAPYHTNRRGVYAGTNLFLAMFTPSRRQQVRHSNSVA